jgi:sulfur carrier protein
MTVILNGRLHELRDGVTVAEVVHELVERPERGVAVALDGAVVPRSEWAATRLSDGQHVEVLRAVQGG